MSAKVSLQNLYEFSELYFSLPTPAFKRYLYEEIDFDAKMIGILGQRGVGKTTLIRQLAKDYDLPRSKMLYISADNIVNGLLDIAKEFSAYGGKLLIIDEIHKANDFAKELKTIYDFLDIKVSKEFQFGQQVTNQESRRYIMAVYLDIRNVLNARNVRWIDSSGRIGGELNDPSAYYIGRRMKVGLRIEF